MKAKERSREENLVMDFLSLMVEGLSQTFGSRCEVVLHDLALGEPSIIKMANSYVSGRSDQSTIDNFKLNTLINHSRGDAQVNYPAVSGTGKYLKSTSLLVRDRDGAPMAALCLNLDMSEFLGMHNALGDMFGLHRTSSKPKPDGRGEVVAKAEDLVTEVLRELGRSVMSLTQDDRLQVVRRLEQKGYFLTRGAVKALAGRLMVSKSTIYNYLERVRG